MGARTDTRERMITSAALLLRERGVAGTSVAKVLEHSDGPRGSVGFHFPGGKAELLTDAVQWAGSLVTSSIRRLGEEGASGGDVFTFMCRHYKTQLRSSDFAAGCPVGAVAQESYADPDLGPVVAGVVQEWIDALTGVLVNGDRKRDEARDLAVLSISALEGAILMSRVRRSTDPIDIVHASLLPLL